MSKKQFFERFSFLFKGGSNYETKEERRAEVTKIRAARDEGKRAWLFKGTAIIAQYGHSSNLKELVGNKELVENFSLGNYAS